MRPLIGITCGREVLASGSARHYQNEAYVNAVVAAGGAPILIPLLADRNALHQVYANLGGLLLSGGGDLGPSRYGQEPHEKLGPTDALRDKVELTLARWAINDDLPVLAICRGIQVLNVALGGTLYQDIPSQIEGALQHPHQAGNPRDFIAHEVKLMPETFLATLFAGSTLPVNSMHHQAVRDLAPGLRVSAQAPDGVIEGIEHPQRRFAIGVQWHPEEMVAAYPVMRRLFHAFVQFARR